MVIFRLLAMKHKIIYICILAAIMGLALIYSCKSYVFRNDYDNANQLLHESKAILVKPFLKAHLKNGDVCILRDTWNVDTITNTVTGIGIRYDFRRTTKYTGTLSIPINEVALFETNTKIVGAENLRIATLAVLAGIDVIVGIICLTNPKACYGSCPTFYINENDNFHYANAEGFTDAITPSMEYGDIDALNVIGEAGKEFSITMRNEALETHCVKSVKLLACPRSPDERVYQTPQNDFYICNRDYPLGTAIAAEGNISSLLLNDDKLERFSPADENNLSSREEIFLTFNNVTAHTDLGLITSFRQTLMSTYLLYSAMGYMGDKVGDYFTMLETNKNNIVQKYEGISRELGGIEVYCWNEPGNKWEYAGEFNERGPIAINRQFLPLPKMSLGSQVKIKLRLNKGLWRIDYTALTHIKQKVTPIEINPKSILNKGVPDNLALKALNSPKDHLVSMPGSSYKFTFGLPNGNKDYELFLYSKGYYLEWMRNHWIKDKNLLKLRQMVYNPRQFLASEAKSYKRYESYMEREFWDSKIDTKTFSYYEK